MPTLCSVAGCSRKVKGQGYCEKHYDRWLKNGTPDDIQKTCQVCGQQFNASGNTHRKYCSQNCRDQADAEMQKARLASREEICSVTDCGRIVYAHGFCMKHWHRWNRHGDTADITRVCELCGKTFTVARNRHSARTCSQKCHNELAYAKRKAEAPAVTCIRCGKTFTPVTEGARLCRPCGGIVSAEKRKREVICTSCGCSFVTSSPQFPICPDCSYQRRIDRTVKRNRRRKALARGAVGPSYTERDWQRLVRRYDGKCAYCGIRPVEHVDHVTPVSRGGTNSIGNILPACRVCNLSKGSLLLVEWKYRGKTHAKP